MGKAPGWNKVKDHKRHQDVRQDRSEYFSEDHSPKILFVQLGFRLLRLAVFQRWLLIVHPGIIIAGWPLSANRMWLKLDAAEYLP